MVTSRSDADAACGSAGAHPQPATLVDGAAAAATAAGAAAAPADGAAAAGPPQEAEPDGQVTFVLLLLRAAQHLPLPLAMLLTSALQKSVARLAKGTGRCVGAGVWGRCVARLAKGTGRCV